MSKWGKPFFAFVFVTTSFVTLVLPQVGSADYCTNMQLLANDSRLRFNDFTIGRGGDGYIRTFGADFLRDLKNLSENDQWLDAGAGQAKALKDLRSGITYEGQEVRVKSRHLKALSLVKPADFKLESLAPALTEVGENSFAYLEGKYLEDTGFDEVGACDLITDFYGPFSYTARIDLVVKKYLELLKVGGKAYVHFSPGSVEIDGSRTKIWDYLSAVKGVKVTAIGNAGETFVIEKTGWTTNESVQDLRLVEFWAELRSVPKRRYAW